MKLAEEGRKDGKDTGLLGNVRSILTELGPKEYWGRANTPKKSQWKKIVRQAVTEWEQRKRKTWKKRKGMSPQWNGNGAVGKGKSITPNVRRRQKFVGGSEADDDERGNGGHSKAHK